MKGTPSTIATRDDMDLLASTNPAAARSFARWLAGTALRSVDTQSYPDDYAAGPEDAGYLPPVIEVTEDLSTLRHFGFDDVIELQQWVDHMDEE